MRWSPAFVDLVVYFARRMAALDGIPIEEALLTSTPLYLNFGLDRCFDPLDPIWQTFLVGYDRSLDPVAWTHSFYLDRAREYPPAPFGCFSYQYEAEEYTIQFHFGNRDVSGFGSLSDSRQVVRRAELAAMFADVRRAFPEAEAVRGQSWMYNLPAYRRLFPPEYAESAVAVEPEPQFMSLWGQFLGRGGNLRPEPAGTFRERVAAAETLDAVRGSFPLPVLAPRCHIDHFYAFYG